MSTKNKIKLHSPVYSEGSQRSDKVIISKIEANNDLGCLVFSKRITGDYDITKGEIIITGLNGGAAKITERYILDNLIKELESLKWKL